MAVFTSIYICTYSKTSSKHVPRHIPKTYTRTPYPKHHNTIHIPKTCTKTPYQNFFASTDKQGRIHSLHLICHLPCSFIGPKVLPLHFNLLDCSILEHEHLFLQYALRLRLEFSIWLHLQYRLVNHMINIFNILIKQ